MKKIPLAIMFLFLMSSVSYCAVSEDMNVYVRQDVFDAKMEAFFNRIHTDMAEMRSDIRALSEKIDGVNKSLTEKIDGVEKTLTEKVDKVNSTLSEKIDGVNKSLTEKIDGVEKTLTEKIDKVNTTLTERIDGVNNTLNEKIDKVNSTLSGKIDGVNSTLSEKTDNLNSRMSDLRNGFYLVVVVFGILFSLPFFNKIYEEHKNRKPALTVEDVERIFERLIDAKLSAIQR